MVDFADTPFSKLRQLNAPLGWAALYVACGLIVVRLQPAGTPALWYPPIAIGIACLLRTGVRYWPIVFAADLIVSLDQYGFAADAAIVSACSALEAVSVVFILRIRSRSFGISDYRDLAWLVLACVVGTLAGASLGSFGLEMLDKEGTFTWSMWLTWAVGDGASAISLLPLILVISERADKTSVLGSSRTSDWERIATIVSTLAIGYVTFGHLPILLEDIQEAIEPLIFLPVLWAAVRLGTRITCIAILSIALSIVLFHLWASALGGGAGGPGVLEIQCFLIALTIVGLSLSLALDRERHQRIEAQAQAEQLHRASEDLRTTSMRLTLAAKAANLGVWDWNLDDNSLVWDDQVYAMYQIDPNTKDKYEAWLQRLHPDDRARLLAEIDGSIKRGEDVSSNFRIVLPNGDERYVNTHGIIYKNEGGKATRIIGIDYDVTELVRQRLKAEASELQAATASRAKSEFLAVMSHELRTPLNAIIGFSDIMAREAFGPLQNPRYSEYVGDIRNSGQMLLSLINDILDLTRIEAGKLDLNLEPIKPAEILGDVARLLAPLAHARNLTLSVEQARNCPPLAADRRALRQLLNNLATNGIKFTDSGGAVTLSAEPVDGRRVALLVADNGRGIPRERIAELCKPFVQIQDSLRRDVGGMGLGLAISRSLAEAMKGSLAIDSDLGRGTTVRVILPAAELS